MSENVPAEEVMKIDPEGKYLVVFPMRLTEDEMARYRETLDGWWNNDSPFLMVDGGVKVIRLEKYDEEKSGE